MPVKVLRPFALYFAVNLGSQSRIKISKMLIYLIHRILNETLKYIIGISSLKKTRKFLDVPCIFLSEPNFLISPIII